LWQLGTMVGAPVGIALIAGISVPAVLIGKNFSHKTKEEWFIPCTVPDPMREWMLKRWL